MRLSEFVANFLAERTSGRVYGICGAGAMHLNDAIANHPKLKVTAMHHEQAAAFAAEADARITGRPAVVMVTAGPGGTNAMTGVACAWVDSIPMIVIAGQVTSHTMIRNSGLRQLGMNELPMVELMRPITKYAVTVTDPDMILFTLERALHLATSGRRGPVFIEIPLDMQAIEIDAYRLKGCVPIEADNSAYLQARVKETIKLLEASERPVIIIGNGVNLARAGELFRQTFGNVDIPVVSSWGAADILTYDHWNYIGRCGIFGDRAANWTVQRADLILAIGTRLTPAQIGHASGAFAPKAKKIFVDIDKEEVYRKATINPDLGVVADAEDFLHELAKHELLFYPAGLCVAAAPHAKWLDYCRDLREHYPAIGEHVEAIKTSKGVNAYAFIEQLGRQLDDDAIILTDVGFCFIPTFQSLKLKVGQRLIHSAGVSPMGWALPAAVGTAMAAPGRQIVCLIGDGGVMMNLQELQTIAQHNLPIAIFVYENDGYATMKIAQNNHFKREVMAGPASGMKLPDFLEVISAFGFTTTEICNHQELSRVKVILDEAKKRPTAVVMRMDPAQVIAPRVQAALLADGKFTSTSLSNMWPPLKEVVANVA